MPHATNHKNTTTTEKIKCACEKLLKHQMLECIVFFLFVKGVYQSVDSVLMFIKQ